MILITENNRIMLNKKNIQFLIVHCSDTPNSENLNASDLHQMHLNFGWNGIGYHKVILRNGEIQNGRPEYWVGAHVKGKNDVSLGVCLIGRDEFTNAQLHSLKKVLEIWKSKYSKAKIIGHCNIGNTHKTCPNFDVITWAKNINL